MSSGYTQPVSTAGAPHRPQRSMHARQVPRHWDRAATPGSVDAPCEPWSAGGRRAWWIVPHELGWGCGRCGGLGSPPSTPSSLRILRSWLLPSARDLNEAERRNSSPQPRRTGRRDPHLPPPGCPFSRRRPDPISRRGPAPGKATPRQRPNAGHRALQHPRIHATAPSPAHAHATRPSGPYPVLKPQRQRPGRCCSVPSAAAAVVRVLGPSGGTTPRRATLSLEYEARSPRTVRPAWESPLPARGS